MDGWRIIWLDVSGDGRHSDVLGVTRDEAVWSVAAMESEHAQLVAVYPLGNNGE